MTEKFKVKVIRIDDHQSGDQFLTLGKVYDAWDFQSSINAVNVIDDRGMESALFDGEWERVDESQS